jgi:excisionase family DNA binding protein
MALEPMLTVQEVAQILRIAESTVYEWKAQGILPAVPLSGKALRFREEDIHDLIERKLVNAETHSFPPHNKTRKIKRSASVKASFKNNRIRRLIESAKKEVLGSA